MLFIIIIIVTIIIIIIIIIIITIEEYDYTSQVKGRLCKKGGLDCLLI